MEVVLKKGTLLQLLTTLMIIFYKQAYALIPPLKHNNNTQILQIYFATMKGQINTYDHPLSQQHNMKAYQHSQNNPQGKNCMNDIPLTWKGKKKKKEILSKNGEVEGQPIENIKEIKEEQIRQAKNMQLDAKRPIETYNETVKNITKQQFYLGNKPSSDLFCPCGKKMPGPLAYFQHIKINHSSDDLQPLIKKQTIINFIQKYPNNQPHQFQIIESFDDHHFQTQIHNMAAQYNIDNFQRNINLTATEFKGTYADLAFKVVEEFGKNQEQRFVLVHFFLCIRHFIVRRFNQQFWQQQSPKDILKMSNHMYHYFRAAQRLVGQAFSPLKIEHLMKLLYILGRWMFINKWTNDRLIRLQPQSQDLQAIQQSNEQNKGKDINKQKNREKGSKIGLGQRGFILKGKK